MAKNDTLCISLTNPIDDGKEPVASLTLRRPTVADAIVSERPIYQGGTASDTALLAEISGVPYATLAKMDLADFRQVIIKGTEKGFFGDSLPRTPSGTK